jgi:uridine phosphorylase
MTYFAESELILNADGSIFHLHLFPHQIADTILLVGDPGRVDTISTRLTHIECLVSNREFVTVTGRYKGKRLSVVSTGIGADNIDIVVNELDALANIDLSTRTEKMVKKSLQLIRIGTCGGLQPELAPGSFLVSEKSIGLDSVLFYYANRDQICDLELEKAFLEHLQWPINSARPYAVTADAALVQQIAGNDMKRGITITANGFYGPQGRALRIPLARPEFNGLLETFEFKNLRITNYEMESSAVAGLGALLGHQAMTVCLVIANRLVKNVHVDYKKSMEMLIDTVLKRL